MIQKKAVKDEKNIKDMNHIENKWQKGRCKFNHRNKYTDLETNRLDFFFFQIRFLKSKIQQYCLKRNRLKVKGEKGIICKE